MRVRLAGADDNWSLCRVDSLCTQGKGLVFHYQRHDFFLRSRLYDKWAVYLAEKDGAVVGSVSACLKNARLNGSFLEVGYFFDLRVQPGHRRQRVATALVQAAGEYLLREGARYGYTYVLGSNLATMTMARKMGMFIAAPFRVFFLSALQTSTDVLPIRDRVRLDDAWRRVEENRGRYDLSERICFGRRYTSPPPPESPFRGIFGLTGRSSAQGCLWDSSVLSTKVVDHVPLPLRAAAALPIPVRRLLGLPAIPAKGEPLRVHHLFDVVWDEENGAAELIKGVRAWAGNEGGRIVMCHLDARDPLCALIKRQAFYSLGGAILLRTPIDGEKPPPLSLTYLDVRDF